eukprot:UN30956
MWSAAGQVGDITTTPDLTDIIDEIRELSDWNESLVFLFSVVTGSGTMEMAPVLKLETCGATISDEPLSCGDMNLCCGVQFDGFY